MTKHIVSQEVAKHEVSDTDLSISLCHAPLCVLEADFVETAGWGTVHASVTVS